MGWKISTLLKTLAIVLAPVAAALLVNPAWFYYGTVGVALAGALTTAAGFVDQKEQSGELPEIY